MTRMLLLIPLLLLIAATHIDQLDADFNAGTLSGVNVTSNQVQLNGSGAGYVLSGTYTSAVKDLGSNPTATISWSATLPASTSVLVSTRAGNSSTPDANWSAWSGAYASAAGSLITSPVSRYYQYRLQLATTDALTTPSVQMVTLTYTPQGPNVTAGTNVNLTEQSTGTFRFNVRVADTVSLDRTWARYRIGNASYGAYTNLSLSAGTHYLDIPAPATGWGNYTAEALSLNVYVNNTVGDSENVTITELIDNVNTPPVLFSILSQSATEGTQKNIFVSGFDPDGDAVTFSTSHGTIQTLTATTAYIVWTPTNLDVGNHTILATISDGTDNDSQNISIWVTDVNTAPTLGAVTNATGHYGDRILFDLTATEMDVGQNLTWGVTPDIFDVEEYVVPNQTTTRYARANFSALDDHRGFNTLVFWVSDGEYTVEQNSTLLITHCGDGTCQTAENVSHCPVDCALRESVEYVAIEVPERLCLNETIAVQTYAAGARYACFYDGRTVSGAAYCTELGAVAVTVYAVNATQRTQYATLTTNTSGGAEFIPLQTGRYRVVAAKADHVSAESLITVRDCENDIDSTQEVITLPAPRIPEPQPRDLTPRVERPQFTDEQTSLLSIIIWYMIMPVLLAGLLYTGNAYYAMNKDVDPRLLKLRLLIWQQRTNLWPKIAPYWEKVWRIAGPIVTPPAVVVWATVGEPIWRRISPLLRRLAAKL